MKFFLSSQFCKSCAVSNLQFRKWKFNQRRETGVLGVRDVETMRFLIRIVEQAEKSVKGKEIGAEEKEVGACHD